MTPANPHASPSGAQGSLLPGGLAYQDFHDLLKEFAAYEAIGTDDALSALLPLMRQVADLHEINRVAPLDGVEDLRVDRGRLWFGNDRAREPRRMTYEISRMQGMAGMLDIGAAPPRFDDEAKELIHVSSERPTKPGFLLGYRCWEHAVGHHDPLTDIFSLGLIGASLATGLDLTEPDQLQAFVTARRRLTQLNRRLHPTAADLLMRMTELDRRRRAQDLRRMIHGFETHRQSHRSHHGGGFGAEPQNRDAKILTELRGRLYDLSRRNKLIYHKPSATELNLTEASAPIVLHVGAIRPEQLFTWTGDLPRRLLSREPLELSEFIRFEEMVYAPAALDKLRTQARKDRTEFGFSQLRLVICFLRWRNLKEAPDEPISSPLLLLPVELKKRRGVRDSYDLRAASQDAEVNPTLRRYLKLLYGVELPPSVDLEQEGEIDRLYQLLRDQIAETEPSVRLEKIDKPPVREIYVRARRRVDLYKKRSKPAGPGVKRYGELAYSYAPTNFRPLGEQLYHTFIAPDLLLELNDQKQRPSVVAATATGAAKPKTAATAAAEKKADTKPQVEDAILSASETQWAFDLCSVTLANFNYRKMSLVRDFDALLEGDVAAPANPARPEEDTPLFAHAATGSAEPQIIGKAAFHALFHDGPKPIAAPPSAPPLEERYPVMPSDPTQDVAIARARAGESYVIQGPPGTGKSQTIANLVADFLGRGKRVLFVCEKRAALDVVHHRLEALNLHRLCALVHDSQEDKRGFVQDIKGLYENWIGAAANPKLDRSRQEAAASAARGLGPLTEVDAGMTSDAGGALVHQVVEQAAAAQELADAARARLGETPLGALPSLADWREGRPAALAVETALKRLGADPVLARHPARYVSADAAADPALFARLTEALNALGPQLDALNAAAELLARRRARGEDGAAAELAPPPLAALFAQIDYAARLLPVADARKLAILNSDSLLAESFRNDLRWHHEAEQALSRAQEKTTLWRDKLSPVETEAALGLALRYEGGFFSFISSAWRQVKAEVTARAGLEELTIKPRIVDMLSDLSAEHEAAAELARAHRALGACIGLRDGDEAMELVAERDAGRPREGVHAAPLMELVAVDGDAAAERLRGLSRLKTAAEEARATINTCFESIEGMPVAEALQALSNLLNSKETLPAFAPALRELSAAPNSVRAALRHLDLDIPGLDAVIAEATVERALAARPALREAQGATLDDAGKMVADALADMRGTTADLLVDRARARFAQHMALTTNLDLEIDGQQRAERNAFIRARQDLDRELGKSTRFRSVRELMTSDAGRLIRDLKPVWLMSPLSVADVLPLAPDLFDVVIFDEASQVPIEDAAPSLFRAPQVVVVGDDKQLPPTNFFSSGGGDLDDSDDLDFGEEETDSLDLDADSLLNQAAKRLPSTLLGWHYRSRSEELIAFSNAVFYGGKLISIPSPRRAASEAPIVAESPIDGAKYWREALARSVSFHHTPFATYDKRRNRGEAQYVAEMVRGLLKKQTGKSIGVIAFSEAQQTEIERALERLARDDAKFAEAYEAELEREEDNQFAGLFVKNLENVQGDERDVIIVSVCYAPDPRGVMRMNFGPINRAGGERRLNVIFSRAKEHVALVSTIKADAITNDYNTGALCLKTYLRYAEAVSCGDAEGMRRALATAAPHAAAEREAHTSALAAQIAAGLRDRGLMADLGVGESDFVCDVAVRSKAGDPHHLAVMIDGPRHYATRDLIERHVVKPGALRAFGWKTMTVLGLDWRRDPERVLARIERAVKGASKSGGKGGAARRAAKSAAPKSEDASG